MKHLRQYFLYGYLEWNITRKMIRPDFLFKFTFSFKKMTFTLFDVANPSKVGEYPCVAV